VIVVTGGSLTGTSVSGGAPTPAPAAPLTWDNPTALIALGHVPGCVETGSNPVPYLEVYAAQILRVVISPGSGTEGEAIPCIVDAVSAGYKVSLVIGYDNSWSDRDVLAYFQRMLGMYGQFAWAISIGNEQELNQDGTQTGAQYATIWGIVEPMVAAQYPHAIRVAGEISPWGIPFVQSALALGLPGAQALAGHPYARPHSFAPLEFATLAEEYGLQAWYSEGLDGQDSWGASIPLSSMPDASMAGIWLN
jgi:hypothetical protein